MSNIISNTFTSYEFTAQEALQGSVFTSLQEQYIQTMLSSIAEEKLSLLFDATNPSTFIQQEASLKGQLTILSYLLDNSKVAAEELKNPTITT